MTASTARDRILDLVEHDALARGFGAISFDDLAEAANISRGGVLYHFHDRSELACAALERFVKSGHEAWLKLVARAEELSEDPRQRVLIVLSLLAERLETVEDLAGTGCLVAAACYQDRLFDASVRTANREAMLLRRRRVRVLLDAAAEVYPPVDGINLDDLADMLTGVIDGALLLSRVN